MRPHILHVSPAEDPAMPPLLARLADELGPAVSALTAVESGLPAPQIIRYAERHGGKLREERAGRL